MEVDLNGSMTLEVAEQPSHPLEIYFDELRRRRRERYAASTSASTSTDRPRRRRAVQTIVHNEAFLLPIWLGYYSQFFAPDDIYVLDHESTDGSTDRSGFVRVPVAHDATYDSSWLTRTVQDHQHMLFDRYDTVLTIDVDEIVATDPTWGTLGEYLDRFDEEFVTCLGWEIVHLKGVEPAFRSDRGVLEQRGFWYPNGGYDKPALAGAPTEWNRCFHTRVDGRSNYDPDLFLIHLHRMDYDLCLERNRRNGDRSWNEADLSEGWGFQNRLEEGESFRRWFYEDSCFDEVPIALQRIPEAWRRVV
jgi:hypothetical protein